MTNDQLEFELQSIRLHRRKLVKDLDNTDTEIIGMKLEQERRVREQRAAEESAKDLEYCLPFDE